MNFTVVLTDKESPKHSTARRLSSPTAAANLNLDSENSEIFEFKQLLDTMQFSSLPQKDTKPVITKRRYFCLGKNKFLIKIYFLYFCFQQRKMLPNIL